MLSQNRRTILPLVVAVIFCVIIQFNSVFASEKLAQVPLKLDNGTIIGTFTVRYDQEMREHGPGSLIFGHSFYSYDLSITISENPNFSDIKEANANGHEGPFWAEYYSIKLPDNIIGDTEYYCKVVGEIGIPHGDEHPLLSSRGNIFDVHTDVFNFTLPYKLLPGNFLECAIAKNQYIPASLDDLEREPRVEGMAPVMVLNNISDSIQELESNNTTVESTNEIDGSSEEEYNETLDRPDLITMPITSLGTLLSVGFIWNINRKNMLAGLEPRTNYMWYTAIFFTITSTFFVAGSITNVMYYDYLDLQKIDEINPITTYPIVFDTIEPTYDIEKTEPNVTIIQAGYIHNQIPLTQARCNIDRGLELNVQKINVLYANARARNMSLRLSSIMVNGGLLKEMM